MYEEKRPTTLQAWIETWLGGGRTFYQIRPMPLAGKFLGSDYIGLKSCLVVWGDEGTRRGSVVGCQNYLMWNVSDDVQTRGQRMGPVPLQIFTQGLFTLVTRRGASAPAGLCTSLL